MLYVDKHALPVAQEALPVASGGVVPVGAHGHDYPVAGETLPVAGGGFAVPSEYFLEAQIICTNILYNEVV